MFGGPLKQIRISPAVLDETCECFDTKVGERHDGIFAWAIDPDQAVLLIHFVGNVPQPILVFAEHFGNTGNRVDMMNFVYWGHVQAAAAVTLDT